MARPPRLAHPAQKVAVAAGALLAALPLLPLAVREGGFHLDELSLDLARTAGEGGVPAAAVAALRWVLGGLLVLGLLAWWGPLRTRPAFLGLRVATLVAGSAALLAAVLFHLGVGQLQGGARPWPNPFLPLAGPLLLALGGWPRIWRSPAAPHAGGPVMSPSPPVAGRRARSR